jgi:hypothetical protein
MSLRVLAVVLLAFSCSIAEKPKTEYFTFHNSFWLNLHQTLYHEAVTRLLTPEQQKLHPATPLDQTELNAGERATWNDAIAFYSSRYKGRRLLFDPELVGIAKALGDDDHAKHLKPESDLPGEVTDVLEKAAPIYRKHWWPEHQKTNQLWIDRMRPRVAELAPKIIPRLEALLKSSWPEIDRVDVSYFVMEVGGAYTPDGPPHTTISSSRPENSGDPGLETVFHEGAHLLTGHLEQELHKDCESQQADCGDLWHAIQFFTVGEVVTQQLAEAGTPGYEPYALKYGLYRRGRWSSFLPLIRKDWQPYLNGKNDFDNALKALAADIKQGESNASGRPSIGCH